MGVSAIVSDSEREIEEVFECTVLSLVLEWGTSVDTDRCRSAGDGIPDKVSRFIFPRSKFASIPESPPFMAARKASLILDRVRRCPATSELVG